MNFYFHQTIYYGVYHEFPKIYWYCYNASVKNYVWNNCLNLYLVYNEALTTSVIDQWYLSSFCIYLSDSNICQTCCGWKRRLKMDIFRLFFNICTFAKLAAAEKDLTLYFVSSIKNSLKMKDGWMFMTIVNNDIFF